MNTLNKKHILEKKICMLKMIINDYIKRNDDINKELELLTYNDNYSLKKC